MVSSFQRRVGWGSWNLELDQMIRVWTIHILEGEEVFVERILVNFGGSTIDNLDWLAVVCFPGDRFQDSLTKEYLTAEHYY